MNESNQTKSQSFFTVQCSLVYLKSNVFECKLILFRSVKILLAIKCVFK